MFLAFGAQPIFKNGESKGNYKLLRCGKGRRILPKFCSWWHEINLVTEAMQPHSQSCMLLWIWFAALPSKKNQPPTLKECTRTPWYLPSKKCFHHRLWERPSSFWGRWLLSKATSSSSSTSSASTISQTTSRMAGLFGGTMGIRGEGGFPNRWCVFPGRNLEQVSYLLFYGKFLALSLSSPLN